MVVYRAGLHWQRAAIAGLAFSACGMLHTQSLWRLISCALCFGVCRVQVSEVAALKRVVLKGDLPIGVDKRSVDTWMEVRLRLLQAE